MKFKKIAAVSLLALMAGMSLASCQSSEDITYNSGFIKEKTIRKRWLLLGFICMYMFSSYWWGLVYKK